MSNGIPIIRKQKDVLTESREGQTGELQQDGSVE